jgi:hypothetical protein
MKTFDSVLLEKAPLFQFGGTATFDRDQLRNDLREVSRGNANMIKLCVALVVVLFVGSVLLVVVYRNEPGRISAISGATGCTLMGDIWAIVSLWKSKVKSDLTIALLSNLGEKDARAALTALLADLKQSRSATRSTAAPPVGQTSGRAPRE